MRVNPDLRSGMIDALQRVTASESIVLRQLSSGKKIQSPSDDPAGMAALIQVQANDSSTQQYLSTIKAIRSQMQSADSSLNSVGIAIERALTLGVRGATGTMTDADREAVATEIDGVTDQLLELANSSQQGTYLFSGTATTTKPFTKSGNNVVYQGSGSSNEIAVGEGYTITNNVPGSSVFGDDGSGLFSSIEKLSTAIRTNGDVSGALDQLQAARENVSSARVVYGNSLNQIDSAETLMNGRHLQLTQQETDIAGADLADAATRLVSSQTSRNALLAAIAKTDQSSLFDYLR
jgi:flagellar hook-associated protein 3 FlgL